MKEVKDLTIHIENIPQICFFKQKCSASDKLCRIFKINVQNDGLLARSIRLAKNMLTKNAMFFLKKHCK
jgi:hypothetical protein